MRRVTYAGETFVTTDEMAAALVDFAVELALGDSSQPISIPAVTEAGESTAEMVAGPASEIITVEDTLARSIDVGVAPAELRERARALASAREPQLAGPIDDAIVGIDDL